MVVTKTLASVTTGLLIMLPFRHALLTACGNRLLQTILKVIFPLQAQDEVCSDQHFNQIFDWRSTASLHDCAPWQTYQDSHPELNLLPDFWWQLVGSCVLRYRLISVRSRLLLPLQHYMISSPRDVSIVLCQIRGLVTVAAHRFSSSLLFCLCWTSSV